MATSSFIAASGQHIGGRDEQQDRVAVFSDGKGAEHLIVVADGVGGQTGGSVAAQIVVDEAALLWEDCRGTVASPKSLLFQLCQGAHRKIRAVCDERGIPARATIVALYVSNGRAAWVHSGDSRLYLFRSDSDEVLRTADHSVVQILLEKGEIEEDEMGTHPDQGRLLQSLGGKDYDDPDFAQRDLKGGESFLLCSDGFWERIDHTEMRDLLEKPGQSLAPALEQSVNLSAKRGGKKGDNTTVAVLVKSNDRARMSAPKAPKAAKAAKAPKAPKAPKTAKTKTAPKTEKATTAIRAQHNVGPKEVAAAETRKQAVAASRNGTEEVPEVGASTSWWQLVGFVAVLAAFGLGLYYFLQHQRGHSPSQQAGTESGAGGPGAPTGIGGSSAPNGRTGGGADDARLNPGASRDARALEAGRINSGNFVKDFLLRLSSGDVNVADFDKGAVLVFEQMLSPAKAVDRLLVEADVIPFWTARDIRYMQVTPQVAGRGEAHAYRFKVLLSGGDRNAAGGDIPIHYEIRVSKMEGDQWRVLQFKSG